MNTKVDRITEYLSVGGLFNPELMEHDKVRDLLIDCRSALEQSDKLAEALRAMESYGRTVKTLALAQQALAAWEAAQ